MADNLKPFQQTPMSYGRKGVQITPSDSTDLVDVTKTVTCLTTGNVSVIPVDNSDAEILNFVGVPAGFTVPYQVRRVRATGTTATVASNNN